MNPSIVHDQNVNDNPGGIDRRGLLKCMAWAGTGVLWTVTGGILRSQPFPAETAPAGELHFVQISDTHLGFSKPANPDVSATLQAAIDKINALSIQPEFLIHTGDLTHASRPAEYDALHQLLQSAKPAQQFFVPGEHDTSSDDGKLYLERYGKGTRGRGWYSFTHKDIHFVGLSNVAVQEGLGYLGDDQIAWLAADLASQPASRPIVIFAHIPLWSVYPEWGWATADSERAMAHLRRFGSVTVLNGHIHQAMQKVEGQVTFHTAMSTAFPQPAPGSASAPGPLKVPDNNLRELLGIADIRNIANRGPLAIVDSTLTVPSQA